MNSNSGRGGVEVFNRNLGTGFGRRNPDPIQDTATLSREREGEKWGAEEEQKIFGDAPV